MIIAIDGPAGSGKSTVAKLAAQRLGFDYIDTGAMYRAVTFVYLKDKGFKEDEKIDLDFLSLLLPSVHIRFEGERIILNEENISSEIRSSQVSNKVSAIAAVKAVRNKLVDEQREMGKSGNVILDGRDIGTVVFPNADHKIFLVASPEIRAQRRLKDLEALGEKKELSELTTEIITRDKKDSERTEGPLKKADDAIEINTDDLSIEEVVTKIIELAKKA